MSLGGGKLCVSVIEARNVQADTASELSFYVKLRLGPSEVKTEVARNTDAPKFLKDVRMNVPNPETDVLRIELLQVGPRGDLIVGTDELRVLTLTSKGTVVHWFELRAFDKTLGAELCLVLRYLSAGINRPMSPSYAIATRQAKDRAMDSAGSDFGFGQGPPKSAFTDDSPQPQGAGSVASEAHSTAQASEAPKPSKQMAASSKKAASPSSSAQKGPKQRRQVPLPVAILSSVLVGVVMHIWKQRPLYYVVQEGDTLCSQGGCFNISSRDPNQPEDPDAIYAGDRLRLR